MNQYTIGDLKLVFTALADCHDFILGGLNVSALLEITKIEEIIFDDTEFQETLIMLENNLTMNFLAVAIELVKKLVAPFARAIEKNATAEEFTDKVFMRRVSKFRNVDGW